MPAMFRSWWQDRILRGIVKNSSYLFSSNGATIVLATIQGILAARLLGAVNYGILIATVIPFVSNVHRLLSFRMSEVVVKYLREYLAEGAEDKAAAIIKGTALLETGTSLVSYAVLISLAPLASRYLAKDPQTTYLFVIYGLVMLANCAYETSTGILQTLNRFDRLALANLLQGLITAGIILVAFLGKGGMLAVLLAYLIGKSFTGLMVMSQASQQLSHRLGNNWWRLPLKVIPDWHPVMKFALSTNLNGTVNLIVRDSETLFITYLRSPLEAGYFRIALSVINLVMLPIEPLIAPTYSEISHAIANGRYNMTRRLLKRLSVLSGAWTLAAGSGLALFGWWLIPLVYGEQYKPAYPAVLILLVGYGFANILNWNRPLLLALGMPTFPLKVSALVGTVKTALTFWLVPVYGYLLMQPSFRSFSLYQHQCLKVYKLHQPGYSRRVQNEDPCISARTCHQ
jgi:O-antigen/teichoic acid export membrane protein